MDPVDENYSTLVQVMAWCWTGDMLVPEAMTPYGAPVFYEARECHLAAMSLDIKAMVIEFQIRWG